MNGWRCVDSRDQELDNVQTWSVANNLQLNQKKSREIVFVRPRSRSVCDVPLIPDIPRVSSCTLYAFFVRMECLFRIFIQYLKWLFFQNYSMVAIMVGVYELSPTRSFGGLPSQICEGWICTKRLPILLCSLWFSRRHTLSFVASSMMIIILYSLSSCQNCLVLTICELVIMIISSHWNMTPYMREIFL